MAYTGKKPVDFVDVTQSQSMTVSDDLTVDTNTLVDDSTNNNVGIGTSSPSAPLHVKSSTANSKVIFEHTSPSTGTGQTSMFVDGSSNVTVVYDNTGSYIIGTSGNPVTGAGFAEGMRIDSSGNVGIGTSGAPSFTFGGGLEVQNAGYSTVKVNNSSASVAAEFSAYDATFGALLYTTTAHPISFGTSGGLRMRLTTDGYLLPPSNISGKIGLNDTRWEELSVHNLYRANEYVLSDATEKKNISSITNGIEKIKQLNPVQYEWLSEDYDDDIHFGFIAQEVESVLPEIVLAPRTLEGDDDEYSPEESNKYNIRQSELVSYLTAALQEAIAKIETLEEKVAALENA